MDIAQGPPNVQQGFNGIPVNKNHWFNVLCWAHTAQARFTFFVRFLHPTGQIDIMKFEIIPGTVDAPVEHSWHLTDGFILGITCDTNASCADTGQCYVSARIQYGNVLASTPYYTFFSGYVSQDLPLSWPQTFYQHQRSGPGTLVCHGDSHTVGNTCTDGYTLPSMVASQLLGVSFGFFADGAVADRYLYVLLTNCMGRNFEIWANDPAPAVQPYYYFFGVGLGSPWTSLSYNMIPLPFPFLLKPSSTIKICVHNYGAGDFFENISYYFEEWVGTYEV